MAWPNPFRRTTPNTRNCWGYTFELTKDHLTEEQMQPLKHSYDTLGEDCLTILNTISPPVQALLPRNNTQERVQKRALETANDLPSNAGSHDASGASAAADSREEPPHRDLYALLEEHHASDPMLSQLWTEITTVPSWVDWEQIARGQDVFYRYGGAALTGLAYQSLLGGMGAARVVETLARTGGFSTKVARRRLFETTQHILQCTKGLDAIRPGGEGFASSIRVRLLHAAVRQRIMKLTQQRPQYYSVEKWGIPINDLDCIATIGTFSATLIWLSFPRQGIFLRQREIEDYIALWRYIAYLVGCPNEYFETPQKAKAIMEVLLIYEIEPTETSVLLANNIIKSLALQPPSYASADFLTAGARWLNGNELSDRLGLMRPSWYYWALMAGQCFFFMSFAYAYRPFPSADRRRIQSLRRIFYSMIVDTSWGLGGKETKFEFKYVPEYSTITEVVESGKIEAQNTSVEWRNLKWLAYGVGGCVVASWCSWRVLTGVLSLVRQTVSLIR